MAKIKQRFRKSGTATYTVEVRVCGLQATKTFSTKKEAQRWATLTEAAIREGRSGVAAETGRKTVADAIQRFRECPPPTAGKWLTGKRGHFLNYWKRHFGRLRISDLRTSAIVEGRDILIKRGRTPATCNRYVSAISTVLQACVQEWFWLERNPAHNLRRLREDNARTRFLSDNERGDLLSACEVDPELHGVVVLALCTGARRGELEGLEWKDIDLKGDMLTFRVTKNGTDRTIPLVPVAVNMLKARFRSRIIGKGDWVFPASRSSGSADFGHRFPRACKRAGIEDFRFHDLRHTAASYLATAGVTERKIAEILGHKTLAMVKRYTHLRPEHLREDMEVLNQALGLTV